MSMNTSTTMITLIVTVLAVVGTGTPALAGNGYGGGAIGGSGCGQVMMDTLASLPIEELSDAEVSSLLTMRQEEKLARDVYLTLQLQWGARIFANIARAEQQHMDLVKFLLDRYGIEDPAADDTIGVYSSETFNELYHQLVEAGSASWDAALTVGATIEDLDIFDLEEALTDAVDNEDIRMVYQNLRKGSRNHMRAFYGQLEMLGIGYTAQYIGQEELLEIVNSERERGTVLDGDGEIIATCGGGGGRQRGGLGRAAAGTWRNPTL